MPSKNEKNYCQFYTTNTIRSTHTFQKQHYTNVSHKDVIEYVLYATRKGTYAFRYRHFFVDYIVRTVRNIFIDCFTLDNICVFTSINYR